MNTLPTIDGRVYYEKLEFEDGFDVLIELFYWFDAAAHMLCTALALLVAKKGRQLTCIADTYRMNELGIDAFYSCEHNCLIDNM